ncbi:MAG: protein kinase [Deltaproteobacteria bacterium]|nr:protein kinase [Deltaproteobacteria bacterium]MCB9786488.1 protein kinase [Deltaproteobacteria bacterium]
MAGELQGIADWRLIDVLGEGARAVVYRAVRDGHGHDEPHVALEVLRATMAQDPDAVRAFEARAEVGASLADRRIAIVLETGRADGRPYVVSELCEGLSLEALPVKRSTGRLRPLPAMWVLREVTAALAAAGRQDPPVVHGALDAGDVLIDPDGDVRIAGFGLHDAPQADLLALARLAQELCRVWPPEVDAWLDRLQDGARAFADAAEALDGFPTVLDDQAGARRGAASAVRRALRKRDEALGEEAAPGRRKAAPRAAGGAAAGQEAAEAQPQAPARPPRPKRSSQRAVTARAAEQEVVATATQARHVVWLCAAILMLAAVVEFYGYGG